ncbi:unnamed protein product [Chilo suppressalis]|uniref:AMP-dependent synthetase/ligase domain-containing protein n=1 Tax=Chilo suppressalis TaxID=168631 RepID=A0ABN8LCI0_CHISP|nr:unnamed protein product [Chilo suppressalis]
MSHAVLRGSPNPSQLYLDEILDQVRKNASDNSVKKERHKVGVGEIIYYSMKQHPDNVYMINGATDVRITNQQLLDKAVPLARTFTNMLKKEAIVMFVMRNHQNMAAIYYASLFSNVILFPIEPNSTLHELCHFIALVSPYIIFCDQDQYKDVRKAVNETKKSNINVVISDDKNLELFCKGQSADLESYQTHSKKFPQPTKSSLLLSTAQWLTHTSLICSCPVYGVSLLMTSRKANVNHVLDILEKYRPSWTLLGPIFAKKLADIATPSQLSSLETVVTTGAPLTENIVLTLKEKLPQKALFNNGMGTTETHGFITMPSPDMHWSSNGHISNTVLYKIVTEDGQEVDDSEKGELYIKSDLCVFKGYYKNDEAYRELMTDDGWFRTGDIFYRDYKHEVYFVERKKFWFKYMNYQIAPEEVEGVISSVTGVLESVVADSVKGPAAAVVLRTNLGCAEEHIRKLIHHTVNCKFQRTIYHSDGFVCKFSFISK